MLKRLNLLVWMMILSVLIPAGGAASEPENPIIIGYTGSLEGKYREPSLMGHKAFQLWGRDVNEKGGLLGRKVKLVMYNDKSDKALTKKLYKKLIEKDKAHLLLAPYSTPLTMVASEVSERHGILMLAVAAAAEKPWQQGARNLFQLYAPAKRQFIGVLDMMAKKNLKTVSIIHDNTSSFNRDIAGGVKKWSRIFKIDVVFEQGFSNGKKQLQQIVPRMRDANAHGLIFSGYPPDSYELIRLLKEMDYRPTVLAMPIAPAHPDFEKKVGDMAEGIMGPSQWEPDERIPFPGTLAFIEQFKAFTGHMPSFHSASAYAACQLYEQAIVRTGSIDNNKLRDYIAALDTATVLGRFKVDPSGLQVGHNSFIIQWQDGKKEIVWPKKMQTSLPVF